jgi:hypothetical protein
VSLLFVVDTETTGLDPAEAGIVELAAVCLRDGQVSDRFSTLVWPGREFLREKHRQALAAHSQIDPVRLLDEDVPVVVNARRLFLNWLCGNAGMNVPRDAAAWQAQASDAFMDRTPLRLTSFNVAFDSKFLSCIRWELGFHCRALAPVEIEWAPCVMLAASQALGEAGKLPRNRDNTGWRWPSLARSCQEFEIPFTETHRALPDAEAAAALAVRLEVA